MKAKYMEIKGIPDFYGRLYVKEERIIEVLKNLSLQHPKAVFTVSEENSAPH